MLDSFGILSILLLVVLNGYFVTAEYALVTVRWTRVEELVARNAFGSHSVQRAIASMEDTIAISQLGVTLTSLGLGWIGEPALVHMLMPLFERYAWPWKLAITHGIAIAIAFILITYVHVVLGELAPKAVALQRAERLALLTTGPLLAFGAVVRPLIWAMRVSSAFVVGLLRLPAPSAETSVHSVDELDMLVEETQEAGVIAPDEAKYVRNVFELADKTVRDVMVPREKVVTLSLVASEDEILETARETAHTRMPVWEDEPNNIVGIVNTKDLFHLFSLRGLVILMDAMYPPLFVDPDEALGTRLRRFRREKRPMAIVREKSGLFIGIVTIEDILEEIVGEMEDEHD